MNTNEVTLTLSLAQADRVLAALLNERARIGNDSLDALLSAVDSAINATLDGVDSTRDEPFDGFRTDVEADADALASAGYGTDEDYGGPAEDAFLDDYWESQCEPQEPCGDW